VYQPSHIAQFFAHKCIVPSLSKPSLNIRAVPKLSKIKPSLIFARSMGENPPYLMIALEPNNFIMLFFSLLLLLSCFAPSFVGVACGAVHEATCVFAI
jgi:hypothetical protein